MFKHIYQDKRVLVTGHTGFKGSWLAVWLRELGATVVGFSLAPPSRPNNFTACSLEDKVTHIYGDVRDLEQLASAFRKHEPEVVFHMAAQALVRSSYVDPKLTFDTNVGGTVNLLEAVRMTPSVKVVINVTSDKCYENQEVVCGYRENDPLGGNDPYSASKGCAELAFAAYRESFFRKDTHQARPVGAASVRAGNAIGGGDWGRDRLIPDCVRALSAKQTVGIRNPRAVRPWQHVLEPLSGYLWLGALLWEYPERYSGPWNFGPSTPAYLTVKEIVAKFIEFWGSGRLEELSSTQNTLDEAKILKLCCDKAQTHLNWQSTLDIEECLRFAVDWYREFYANAKAERMYEASCNQIERYAAIARNRHSAWVD